MPVLRQLEFASRGTSVAEGVDLGCLGASQDAGVTAPGYNAGDLETTARELLRSIGACPMASELGVEWNSRLKTAAGGADYRENLISLNPRLIEHPNEIDRTLRHELAHILAQFRARRRRITPHGVEWQRACVDLGIADEK